MSGDYSRLTFDPMRDFAAVLAEQGRVSTDADFNELVAAVLRRAQAESLDTVGHAAVPLETPDGFRVQAAAGGLTIGRGRIYVDGLLAENHGQPPLAFDRRLAERRGTGPTPYGDQPYYPSPPALPAGAGPHVAYLKVWQREVTAVEDPRLIEPALGVDTTARLQTVWQVRVLPDVGPGVTCATRLEDIAQFVAAEPGAGGRLTTGTIEAPADPNPCHVPPGGGYKGLENQLYRVEIHRGGTVGGASGARFKWSRDNGTVATRVTHVQAGRTELVVESIGRDAVLGFSDGDWVEVTDDVRELAGLPGEMRRVQVDHGVDDATRTITLTTALPAGMFPVDGQGRPDPGRNMRVRRWDQAGRVLDADGDLVVDLDAGGADGTIPVAGPTTAIQLEHGVVVRFHLEAALGTFRTGDWWCFAARTATGDIEPLDRTPPQGVHAHYAKLALVSFPDTGTDCRVLVAPLDDRFTLFYVSGDTQQARPDVDNPSTLVPLPHDLVVGVANGGCPVSGRRVRFVAASGRLGGSDQDVTVTTGTDGLARIAWELDSASPVQTAVATLLAGDGTAPGLPVQFSATLALAGRVAYHPDQCANLAGTATVQEAIDRLCGIAGGGCDTLSLSPGTDWVDALESLAPGTSATVCFRRGTYTTERPVVVRELDHIRLTGAGPATAIVGRTVEAALMFEGCASVHLADLSVAVDRFPQPPVAGLLGAVTTTDCARVELERVRLTCPPGGERRATCLTARSRVEEGSRARPATLVRVRDCELVVGHGQTGVLVVNAERVVVSGSGFTTLRLPADQDIPTLLTDRTRLASAVNQLARNLVIDRRLQVRKAGFNTAFPVRGFVVRINSPVPEDEWKAMVEARPPTATETADPAALAGYVQRLVDAAAAEGPNAALLPSFGRLVTGLTGRLGSASARFLDSAEGRASLRTLLAGDVVDVAPEAEAAAIRRAVNVGALGGAVRFDSALSQQAWEVALAAMPPPVGTSPSVVASHVKVVARRILLDPAFSARVAPGLLAVWAARNQAAAACGVRVAGAQVGDVVVEGNSFRATAEAIHVAASFRRENRFSVRSVRAQGNDVVLSVPFELREAPRAVFVGNADRIVVRDNRSRVLAGQASAGIHLEGEFGPHVAVRDNDVRHCETGVLMVRHGTAPERPLWVIADNLARDAGVVVDAPGVARVEGNIG